MQRWINQDCSAQKKIMHFYSVGQRSLKWLVNSFQTVSNLINSFEWVLGKKLTFSVFLLNNFSFFPLTGFIDFTQVVLECQIHVTTAFSVLW